MVCWHHFFKEKKISVQRCATTYLFTRAIFMIKTLKITIECGEQRNVVFGNFWTLFMRSSTFRRLLFFPEKHFAKIWSKLKFWLLHASWSQDIFKHKYKVHFLFFLLLSPALRFFFSFSSSFYLPVIRNIQIVLGNVLITHRGPSNFFR